MPPGRRDDEGAIPRVLRPAVASGASPCGSSTKRPSVVARCPHQGVATPAMAGMTEVVWSATTPDGDAIARVWNDAQCVMSGLARGDSIRAGMWPLQLSYGDACADAVRLIPRPPGLGRTGRATGRATGISEGRAGRRLHRGYSPTVGMKAAPRATSLKEADRELNLIERAGRGGGEIGRKAEQSGFAKLAENE